MSYKEEDAVKLSSNLKYGEITDVILPVFYKKVYAHLGYGFLEKVYENAMAFELRERGLRVVRQQKIDVYYRGMVMGEYFADLVVDDKVIVELKAVSQLLSQHEAQLMNYLRATQYEVGLLLNFGSKPAHRRKVFDNSRKSVTWEQND
ncbi:MAG: GxxExxY protein [Chloroflexota bacterium]